MSSPLDGVRIIEIAAIGPAPYGLMLLGDLGADVIRIDRISSAKGSPGMEIGMFGMSRNRRSVALDLKSPEGVELLLQLCETADVIVEGFRPGVIERLGFGPEVLLGRNPRLVVARMTGWGQEGPMRDRAGHDANYIALAGALHPIGRVGEAPPPPLNLIGDFGGGGTFLAMGVMAALLERQTSGRGQVVDVAMVDGAASLTAMMHGFIGLGAWRDERGSNMLDGGVPYYDNYMCADGGFVAVGAIEPHFHAQLLEGLGIDPETWPQSDTSQYPRQRAELQRIFLTRTRDEWDEIFAGTDACVLAARSLVEATTHPFNTARDVFIDVDGMKQPAPAPRFSRTPGSVRRGAPQFGEQTDEILAEIGLDADRLAELRAADTIA